MNHQTMILPHKDQIDHKQNLEFFLDKVRSTVGFQDLKHVDRQAYIAGASMMFLLLGPYAQLRLDIEIDRRHSVEHRGNEHLSNLKEIVRILKQYEGD